MTLHVVPMSLREANDFVESFHRHNGRTSRDGGKFAIGASDGGRLVGVAIVGRPVARLLADAWTAEVLRCCVVEDAPKGTCSFLYGRSWRVWQQMGGKRIVTYTLPEEGGASLRGAGWKMAGESKPHAKGWATETRARRWQPIYGQTKFRWEQSAPDYVQHTCTPQTHNLDTKRADTVNADDLLVLKDQQVTTAGEFILD